MATIFSIMVDLIGDEGKCAFASVAPTRQL